MAAAKLDIKRELRAVDQKDYDFYKNLTDEEKKSFNPFILMRYTSNCTLEIDLQEWFIEQTNECINKNYISIGSKDHKELMWKLYAAIGTGINCYHPYLALGKKEKANKIEKLLCEIHPTMKLDDVKVLASLMTKDDCNELFDQMGFDKKQRKEYASE